jgi:diaminohydroxyphosphoribosylaminopyrimidine deaminase/5-amino-6-(5-phosphoribosylamino)uracil reductase
LREARKGMGRTSPNPAVGAVIVRDGRIVAKGYHRKAGLPHAEIEALGKLGGKAPGDVLYVTLEPCNHHGKTPPCTEAILRSGLRRVVVGMTDPNPRVTGGGCEFLRHNGIEVVTGILETECRLLNEVFVKFVTTGRPFVVAKSALTLDGWTATSRGHSKWITNERSRQFVHRLRNQMDATMVGIGTVLADNPSLTTRLERRRGKDPLRILVDTHLRTPLCAKVLNPESPVTTLIVVKSDLRDDNREIFQKKGASLIACPIKAGLIDLNALMNILGRMSITSVLVEGGASIMASMLREKLIDKFYIFMAPKILGGEDGIPMAAGPGSKRIEECLVLKNIRIRRFADDILVMGYPCYPD